MADLDILFEALVEPAPYRKSAGIVQKKGGRPHAALFTSSRTKTFQAQLAAAAQPYAPAELIDEPVRVDVLAVMARPKRLMRRADPEGLVWGPGKPDADNLRKAVLDALKAWWRDDSLVVCGQTVRAHAEKTGHPRTVVRVRTLAGVGISSIVGPVFEVPPSPATSDDGSGGAANDWVEQAIREAAGAP